VTKGVGLTGWTADTVDVGCSDGATQTDGRVGAVGWVVWSEGCGTTSFAAGDGADEAEVVWACCGILGEHLKGKEKAREDDQDVHI